jgi:hypothetical protein
MFQETELHLSFNLYIPVNLEHFIKSPEELFPNSPGFSFIETQVEVPVPDMLQKFRKLPKCTIQEIIQFHNQCNQYQADYQECEELLPRLHKPDGQGNAQHDSKDKN